MRVERWILPAVAVFLIGCGSGRSDFATEHAAQLTISLGEAATLALPSPSMAQVYYPAGTFGEEVIVMLGDQLLRTDASWRYFPTVNQAAITEQNTAQMEEDHIGDLWGALVVNTPADVQFHRDVTVRFSPTDTADLQSGETYVVYRFDFQSDTADSDLAPRWLRWGNDVVATVVAGGAYAEATLPTTDFYGYVGSLAIFKGQTAAALAGTEQTTRIYGKVINSSGAGIATDVGIYVTIGGRQYPAGLEDPNARTPVNVSHPFIEGQVISVPNTVDSDADGLFEMLIPDRLIGQFVHLEFGTESAAYQTQYDFDLLAQTADPDNSQALVLLAQTTNMVIWYGENKLRSLPVLGAN
jgi:hypothetical protein